MKAQSFFLTIIFLICFSATAQVDDFQERIIACLQVNGTKVFYEEEYDNTLHLLLKQFDTSQAPETFWQELRKDKDQKIDELIPLLAFAYRKHFTEEDIVEMNEFYSSETAKIWQENPGELTEEQQREVDSFLEGDIGEKMNSNRNVLREDMDEIASHWKRELFAEKMRLVVKSGFTPQ